MTKQTTIVVTGALRVNISASMYLKFNIQGKVKTLISIKGVNAVFFFVCFFLFFFFPFTESNIQPGYESGYLE